MDSIQEVVNRLNHMKVNEPKLHAIGFWKSYDSQEFPDPATFVDEAWNLNEKAQVIRYLEEGVQMPYAIGGFSWCRFHCGIKANGSQEFSDGYYMWPEGFAHYLEAHHVKPPEEFISHCLNPKPLRRISSIEAIQIDYDWWVNQSGPNKAGPPTFLYPPGLSNEFAQHQAPYAEITLLNQATNLKKSLPFLKACASILHTSATQLYTTWKNRQEIILDRPHWERIKLLEDADAFVRFKKWKF